MTALQRARRTARVSIGITALLAVALGITRWDFNHQAPSSVQSTMNGVLAQCEQSGQGSMDYQLMLDRGRAYQGETGEQICADSGPRNR